MAVKQCALCSHPDRRVFDEAISKSTPLEQIAVGWSLPIAAVRKHRGHVAAATAAPTEAPPPSRPASPKAAPPAPAPPTDDTPATASDTVTRVLAQIERVMQKAETDPEASYADKSSMLRAATHAANLLARIRGEAAATVTEASIAKHPAFLRIVAAMVKTLEPWPEAMAAVGETVGRLEGGT